VPSPVIFVHVSKGGIDATLGSSCMASCREELRYAGRVEACLAEADDCSKAGAATANNKRIVLVIL
jgi:hypothetical protein